MIHSFSCKNFYSFYDEATISFVVNDNAPQNDGYFKAGSDVRLSKIATVVGPNASGKTNLLKVLPFLKWFIIDSFKHKYDDPIIIQPFAFSPVETEPSELSVVFEISSKIYTYSFSLVRERILNETLERTIFVKEKKGTQRIFSRIWNEKKEEYDFDDQNFDLPKGFENSIRSNASVIGIAAQLAHRESQEISKFWDKIETNVIEAGWIGDHLLPNATQQLIEVLDFYSENDELKQKAERLLSRFDLGFDSFAIEKKKTDTGISINAKTVHQLNGAKYDLNLTYESSGTKQLFVLLKSILAAIAHGSIAIIDEFDVNLHPEMVIALFELFIQPETNPKNAQLILSTHSHLLLSKLDKYQIILVEKNEKGGSEAWRLDDVSGVRSDDNYFTKYIAGTYGAVPKL